MTYLSTAEVAEIKGCSLRYVQQLVQNGKTVTREYDSGDLMELDYSDETVTFSKVKTSQKNKTYEMGTDSGYTLVIKNQYISYGLDDTMFETYLTKISEYYTGFALTPMSFTLAEPDFDLRVGDRIQVYDEEEQVTITGNVSKIVISGNCSMTVICGGFENVSSTSDFTPTSYSQVQQASQGAKCDGKLHDIAGTTAEARLVSGSPYASRIIGTNPDGSEMFEVGNSGGNIILSGEGAELMLSAKRGTIDIHAGNNRYGIGIGPSSVSISAGNGHTLSFSFDGAGVSSLTITPPSGHGKAFTIRCGNDGYSNTSISVPGHILEFDGDEGLLYNGKRVLTEDIKT